MYLHILNLLIFAGVIITCVLYADMTLDSYSKFIFCMTVVLAFGKYNSLATSYLPVLIAVVYTVASTTLYTGELVYNRVKKINS